MIRETVRIATAFCSPNLVGVVKWKFSGRSLDRDVSRAAF